MAQSYVLLCSCKQDIQEKGKTMTTKTTFATITDVIDAITPALGDFANDYDIEGIAREISEWKDGKLVADLDRDDFWDIAQRHDNTAHYEFFAHIDRMLLCRQGERYVELSEDEDTGSSYIEGWFKTEDEAIAFVKDETTDYIDRELGGRGFKVNRTRRGLDSVSYVTGQVERYLIVGEDNKEILDYGNDPKTSHFYEGYFESSLPEDVRSKAMAVQASYHRFLDYESESYGSLADELED